MAYVRFAEEGVGGRLFAPVSQRADAGALDAQRIVAQPREHEQHDAVRLARELMDEHLGRLGHVGRGRVLRDNKKALCEGKLGEASGLAGREGKRSSCGDEERRRPVQV